MSLPARGRSIEGHVCKRILTENLPQIIEKVRQKSDNINMLMLFKLKEPKN